MTIAEEDITRHLNFLLGQADEGDSMHHLIVVGETPGEIGPLGLPGEPKHTVSFYAIAADESVEDPEIFVGKVIAAAAVDHHAKQQKVVFAAISQEVWAIEHPDEAARKAIAEGRLREVPGAAEATVVYGTCHDGRRWHSRRWVTGPKAGLEENVDILTGPVTGSEFFGMSAARLMRALVGLRM